MKGLGAFILGDLRNVLRDRMLAVLPLVPFLAAAGLRFLIPFGARVLALYFDLRAYDAYFGAFFLLLGPAMLGFVAAFLFLDENEAGILAAFAVSPVGLLRLGSLRFAAYALLSILSSLAAWPILGVESPGFGRLLAAAVLAALVLPSVACFILAFSKNKVEGLTISKLAGFVLLVPVLPAVAPHPWAFVGAVFPTWWSAAAFLGPHAGGLPVVWAVAGGAAVSALWLAAFGRLALARIAR